MTYSSRHLFASCIASLLLLFTAGPAQARMALVVGEPFGSFGTMMPQGHAGIYVSNLCVETAIHLRPCRAGEPGAVISRYHDLRHPELDWMAFPLPVFLYGSSDPANVPGYITASIESEIRARYRNENLLNVVPDRVGRHGDTKAPPYGDWEEGIGSAFDRRLLMYEIDTTPAQDAAVLQRLNDEPNHRAYTLGRHNCADFAADLLRLVLPPELVHRNRLGDLDMTTPKELARIVDTYGHAHPELHLAVYSVPQLPGSLRRSRPLRGAAESLLTTKRYLATLLAIQPDFVLFDWIAYEKQGKWKPGLDAQTVTPGMWTEQPSANTALSKAPTPGGGDMSDAGTP